MFLITKLLSALVLPPFGLIALALAGLWVGRRRHSVGHIMTMLALISMLALSVPIVSDGLTRSLEKFPALSQESLSRAEAIVIIGGGMNFRAPEYGGDTVNRWTLERLRYGARLQAASGLPILVSGGAPYGGRPEAEAMKESLVKDFHGQVAWVENTSRNTAENAVYSAGVLKAAGVSRIVLVSQAWHLPRAVEYFAGQSLEVIPAPTGFASSSPSMIANLLPSAEALSKSSNALHEWLGILVQSI
ncbi:MAG: YdcF family protein [Georgfuchsia sp.]